MARVLLYPIIAIISVAFIAGIGMLLALTIEHVVRARALRRARWEFFAEPAEAGQLIVGVQLVARCAYHVETVRRDPQITRVDAEDFVEFAIAKAHAQALAEVYNTAGKED